jgi:regulator of nucleoside diphosphate kinase
MTGIAQIVDPQDCGRRRHHNSRVVVQDVETAILGIVLGSPSKPSGRGRLSVVSPIGTAILGYAKDDVLTWQTPGGPRKIKIAAIPYQPEAAGDFNL